MRGAHTLIEMMVALLISGVALSALYYARFTRPSRGGATVDAAIASDVQLKLRQLSLEIQQATRVFYPLPGEGDRDGLAIVDLRGRVILYHREAVDDAAWGRIWRVDTHEMRETGKPPASWFVDRVRRFRVSVAPAEPGKQASLVNIDIGVEAPSGDPQSPIVVGYVSAAFLRNLERTVPEDIFPPGTPLVRPE